MKYTKQKDLPQGIQKEQQTQGIALEQRQGAGFLCIPFCFLPPSGALVSRENVKEAGASEIRKPKIEPKVQGTRRLLWTSTNQFLKDRKLTSKFIFNTFAPKTKFLYQLR